MMMMMVRRRLLLLVPAKAAAFVGSELTFSWNALLRSCQLSKY